MSYILMDAGNTCLKVAHIIDFKNVDLHYEILSYEHLFDDLFLKLKNYSLSDVIICNVNNSRIYSIISDVVFKLWQIQPILISVEQSKYGISTCYSNPNLLGVDRWVAMIAARSEFKNTLCVIDCGTAVTIDVVTDLGVHIGGLISPGLDTSRKSLGLNANNLPSVDNVKENNNNESSFLAINTEDAILGGTLYQLSAYIERIVSEIKEEYGEALVCVITGGDADKIQALTYHYFHYRETLVLDGLRILAKAISEKESI